MPSEIGVHIRQAREKAGIGLRELARRIDRSPTYLVVLETGHVPPGMSEETLTSIARELDLDIDVLMSLAAKVPAALRPKNPLEIEIYRLIQGLSLERQIELAEALRTEAKGTKFHSRGIDDDIEP